MTTKNWQNFVDWTLGDADWLQNVTSCNINGNKTSDDLSGNAIGAAPPAGWTTYALDDPVVVGTAYALGNVRAVKFDYSYAGISISPKLENNTGMICFPIYFENFTGGFKARVYGSSDYIQVLADGSFKYWDSVAGAWQDSGVDLVIDKWYWMMLKLYWVADPGRYETYDVQVIEISTSNVLVNVTNMDNVIGGVVGIDNFRFIAYSGCIFYIDKFDAGTNDLSFSKDEYVITKAAVPVGDQYDDDFSTYTVGQTPPTPPWEPQNGVTDWEITTDYAMFGGKTLRRQNTGASHCFYSFADISGQDVEFSAFMRAAQTNEPFFMAPKKGAIVSLYFGFNATGEFTYHDGSFHDLGVSYSADKWYYFRIKAKWGGSNYNLFNLYVYDPDDNYNLLVSATDVVGQSSNTSINVFDLYGYQSAGNFHTDRIDISLSSLEPGFPTGEQAIITLDAETFGASQIVDMSSFATIETGGTTVHAYSVDGGAYSNWLSKANFQAEGDPNCSSSFQIKSKLVGEITEYDDLAINYEPPDVTPCAQPNIKVLETMIEGAENRLGIVWDKAPEPDFAYDVIRIKEVGGAWKYLEVASGTKAIILSDVYNENIPVRFRLDGWASGSNYYIPRTEFVFGEDFNITLNKTYAVAIDRIDESNNKSGFKESEPETIEEAERGTEMFDNGLV